MWNEADKKRSKSIRRILRREYPNARCMLKFKTPFELLVATMLSAQCTDEVVLRVSKELFKKYNTAKKMAVVKLSVLEEIIRPAGLHHSKAKNIIATSNIIVDEFSNKIPRTMEELLQLRGVGRKTANLVLSEWFNTPVGIVVDTHVIRLSRLLHLTVYKEAVKIEQELMLKTPKCDWINISHWLIWHGRAICSSRKKKCALCVLKKYCPSTE